MITQYDLRLNDERIPYLVREESFSSDAHIDTHSAVVQLMNDCFFLSSRSEEYIYMIAFDCALHIKGIFEIGHGLVDGCLISPREILQRALLVGATSMIVVHNHPSGNPTPSEKDYAVFSRLKEAGELMGIRLLDFIVIGDGYCSFTEMGADSIDLAN